MTDLDTFCDASGRYHRGGRICNAMEIHDNRHDGYADNSEAYLAGWNIAASALEGMDPTGASKTYTARPGPDRLAFMAGWIERQEQRKAARAAAPTFDEHDQPDAITAANLDALDALDDDERRPRPKCAECGKSQRAGVHHNWQTRTDYHPFV